MTHNKKLVPNHKPLYNVRLGAGSPFVKHHGRGRIEKKDYTKFIHWTPRKMMIATFVLGVPYGAVVAIVATQLSWMAALPLIVLMAILVGFMALLHGLSKLSA